MSLLKILVATTNAGKFKEIKHFFKDLPARILSLQDLKKIPSPPPENEPTIWGNAVVKSCYYGEASDLLTLADDSGLFIAALNGWPGVISARIGKTDHTRRQLVLQKMRGVKCRHAIFRTVLALYDPIGRTNHLTTGEVTGEILTKAIDKITDGFGFDPIFFVTKNLKTYSEMTKKEKNSCSHRGQALIQMKKYLQKIYF